MTAVQIATELGALATEVAAIQARIAALAASLAAATTPAPAGVGARTPDADEHDRAMVRSAMVRRRAMGGRSAVSLPLHP